MKIFFQPNYRLFIHIIVTLLFCFSIFTPLITALIQDDLKASSIEKRNLAVLPDWPMTLHDWEKLPSDLTQYYSDHFGFRELFNKVYFKMLRKIGSSSSLDDVTVGKEGWLFLGSIKKGYTNYDDPIGDAIHTNLYSLSELEQSAEAIARTHNWLKSRGIKYLYVIAPNKHTIYFEYLPDYLKKINPKSATDQLVEYLTQNTQVDVLDLREPLMKAKGQKQLYYKSDTHWNYYGANIAQFEIMKRLQKSFPNQIIPKLLPDSSFEITQSRKGDLAIMAKQEEPVGVDLIPKFNGDCLELETFSHISTEPQTLTCEIKPLSALIFRDSFFKHLKPYTARQFARSTYIFEKLNELSLKKYVTKEKPDIVIDEVVERTLPYIPQGVNE